MMSDLEDGMVFKQTAHNSLNVLQFPEASTGVLVTNKSS